MTDLLKAKEAISHRGTSACPSLEELFRRVPHALPMRALMYMYLSATTHLPLLPLPPLPFVPSSPLHSRPLTSRKYRALTYLDATAHLLFHPSPPLPCPPYICPTLPTLSSPLAPPPLPTRELSRS